MLKIKKSNVAIIIISVIFTYNMAFAAAYNAQHFTGVISTPSSMTFYGGSFLINSSMAQPGDEIGVYDPDGVLCGLGFVPQAGFYVLTVYADDSTTVIDEGAKVGDKLTFKIWDMSENCEKELTQNELIPVDFYGKPPSDNPPIYSADNDSRGLNINATCGNILKPIINSITPNKGSTDGGTSVIITGTNFASNLTVKFGSTTINDVEINNNGTEITCKIPSNPNTGSVNIVVTNPDGNSGSLLNAFTYFVPDVPAISQISPVKGSKEGNTKVTISGNNFKSGISVKFGSNNATNISVNNDGTQITCSTPAHSVGHVDVIVTNSDGKSDTLNNGFEYIITQTDPVINQISPVNGSEQGNTQVTISGNNFNSGLTVKFGNNNATNISVNNDGTQITCSTPAHSAGQVDIIVTNLDGKSDTFINGFEYNKDDEPVNDIHFQNVKKSTQSVVFYGDNIRINNMPFEIGDEIAAYDQDGNIAGATQIINVSGYILTVYADDPDSKDIDEGADSNEELIFKVWDKSENKEHVLDETMFIPEEVYGIQASPYNPPKWTANNDRWGINLNVISEQGEWHFSNLEETSDYMDIYGQIFTFQNKVIDKDDEIGIFVDDDKDGKILVGRGKYGANTDGKYGIIHVYGDDPNTDEIKEGADLNDILYFKIWDQSEQNEYDAKVISGDNNFIKFGEKEINLGLVVTQVIPLVAGWNQFSFSVNKCFYIAEKPTVNMIDGIEYVKVESIDDILSSLNGQYSYVKGFDINGGKSYNKSMFSSMKYMAAGYGYWIKVDDNADFDSTGQIYLKFEGVSVQPDTSISLFEGWNLVGHIGNKVQYIKEKPFVSFPKVEKNGVVKEYVEYKLYNSIPDIFNSINGQFSHIRGFDEKGAKSYSINIPDMGDLKYVGPGYAYWIKVTPDSNPVLQWENENINNK